MNLLTPRQKLQRVRAMAEELQEMFVGCSPSVAIDSTGSVRLGLHACRSYDYATSTMRGLGFGKRDKQTLPIGKTGRTALNAKDETLNMVVTAYANELPPTCKIKVTMAKRKKRVTLDEYVEVEKREIVCETGVE